MHEPRRGRITDLATLLELEVIDRDLFRAQNGDHGDARHSIYGGQVAAQALRAAGLTVPDDRHPHSLHGYFLRPGAPDHPVILQVDRDRDGRSFSARHVRAVQHGEVIFSMLASFHVDEPSAERDDIPAPDVPGPSDTQPHGWDRLLDIRELHRTDFQTNRHSNRMWVRSAQPLPDDRLVHACALTYVSDLGSGFGQIDGPVEIPRGGPSIDHALWFHAPLQIDDWVLVDLYPAKAGGSRGLYHGSIRDRSGTLGALIGQELLLRPYR